MPFFICPNCQDRSIDTDRVESLTDRQAEQAARILLQKGFRSMKTQMALPGDPTPAEEVRRIRVVRDAIGPNTCGIIVEPVQGEGGVRPADIQFLRDLRAVCDEYGLILGMDEVQTGMGRTGKLFAHEWAGITPDVMSAAKGIGGGFPLGAVLAKEQFAKALVPGTHGTTYGGNPLACTAGNAVLDVISAPGFLDEVVRKGKKLRAATEQIAKDFPDLFVEARGLGLLSDFGGALHLGR